MNKIKSGIYSNGEKYREKKLLMVKKEKGKGETGKVGDPAGRRRRNVDEGI